MLLQDQNVWLHPDHALQQSPGQGARSSLVLSDRALTEHSAVDADGIPPWLLLLDLGAQGRVRTERERSWWSWSPRFRRPTPGQHCEGQRPDGGGWATPARHVGTGTKSFAERCLRTSDHKKGSAAPWPWLPCVQIQARRSHVRC